MLTGAPRPEICDGASVRNNPNPQPIAPNRRHRQADAIHRNRTFFDNVFAKADRYRHLQHKIFSDLFPATYHTGGVYMTLHKMSIQSAIRAQRTFQIHERAGLQFAKVCAAQRFIQNIKRHQRTAFLYHGQAGAVDGDAAADTQRFASRAGADGEFGGFLPRPDTHDHAGFFNNSSKHTKSLPASCAGEKHFRLTNISPVAGNVQCLRHRRCAGDDFWRKEKRDLIHQPGVKECAEQFAPAFD